MPSTVGRIVVAPLTNKSGGAVALGDVVIADAANDSSFTTTTTGAITSAIVGVVVEPNGIANNSSGRVQFQGLCPQVNLNASATRGYFIKTHTVAKQGTSSSTRVTGSFGQAMTTSSTPIVMLWGWPDGSAASGNVAVDAIWDAKGDSAWATGADAATKLTAGSNGMVPVYDSSQSNGVKTAYPPGYELDRVSITSPVSVSATTEGGADVVITGTTLTYPAIPLRIEFFSPNVQPGAGGNNMFIIVTKDGATSLGRIANIRSTSATGALADSCTGVIYDTPTNASHTYYVRAYFDFANTGTRSVGAGAGGSSALAPAFMRVVVA